MIWSLISRGGSRGTARDSQRWVATCCMVNRRRGSGHSMLLTRSFTESLSCTPAHPHHDLPIIRSLSASIPFVKVQSPVVKHERIREMMGRPCCSPGGQSLSSNQTILLLGLQFRLCHTTGSLGTRSAMLLKSSFNKLLSQRTAKIYHPSATELLSPYSSSRLLVNSPVSPAVGLTIFLSHQRFIRVNYHAAHKVLYRLAQLRTATLIHHPSATKQSRCHIISSLRFLIFSFA